MRHKTGIKSALDDIKGVGPVRKKKLKDAYGTVNEIAQKSRDELLTVLGEKTSADAVYKALEPIRKSLTVGPEKE